jgi:hypothetical protein
MKEGQFNNLLFLQQMAKKYCLTGGRMTYLGYLSDYIKSIYFILIQFQLFMPVLEHYFEQFRKHIIGDTFFDSPLGGKNSLFRLGGRGRLADPLNRITGMLILVANTQRNL